MVFTTGGFLEVGAEGWPEWDLNPWPFYMYSFHSRGVIFYIGFVSDVDFKNYLNPYDFEDIMLLKSCLAAYQTNQV